MLRLLFAKAIKVQGEYVFSFHYHVVLYPVDNKNVRISRATVFIAFEF